MHILRHATEVSAYIATQPQGAISTLIEQRLQELSADGLDHMEEIVFFVVLEPSDSTASLEAALHRPLQTPTGHPLWECLQAHPDCLEMVFVLEDSGYGAIVLLPTNPANDSPLHTLFQNHLQEHMP